MKYSTPKLPNEHQQKTEDKHRDSVLTSCLDITAEIQTFGMNYFRSNSSKLVSFVQSKHIGVKVPCFSVLEIFTLLICSRKDFQQLVAPQYSP